MKKAPMGWNSYDYYDTTVTEEQVKANADMYGVRKNADGAQAYYDSIISLYAQWGVDFVKCDDICNTNLYKENCF